MKFYKNGEDYCVQIHSPESLDFGCDIVYYFNGEEFCDEERALSILLLDDKVFCNTGTFNDEKTVCLFVNCSDVFAWGCADAEAFTTSDIPAIWKLYHENQNYGTAKWCCLKRNMQPQAPVKQRMIEHGVWDDAMEALPENRYDKLRLEARMQKKDVDNTANLE